MLGLMIRDLMVQRKRLWVGILYCVLGPILFKGMGQAVLVIVVVAVEYMILLTAFAYDDKYKVDATLASLPIARAPLVIVRYLEVPVLAAAATLLYILVTSLLSPWIKGLSLTGWLYPSVAFLTASVMSALYMPVVYWLGYVKARIFNMIIFMACVFLPSFGMAMIYGKSDPQIPAWLVNASEGVISIAMAAAAVVILVLSCMISIRLYRRRQL
jgi:hypothetical protein